MLLDENGKIIVVNSNKLTKNTFWTALIMIRMT
jgi:hypothetical protein